VVNLQQLLERHRLIVTTEGIACSCESWWQPGATAKGRGFHDFQHHLLEQAMPVRFEIRRPASPDDPGISGHWG
jgi:hypothetical protein